MAAFVPLPASPTAITVTAALAAAVTDLAADGGGPGVPTAPGSTSAGRREHPPPAPPLPALPLLSANTTKRGVTTVFARSRACHSAAPRAPSGVSPFAGMDGQRWGRAAGELVRVREAPAAGGRERDALCAGE